jgi:hypothetical protein
LCVAFAKVCCSSPGTDLRIHTVLQPRLLSLYRGCGGFFRQLILSPASRSAIMPAAFCFGCRYTPISICRGNGAGAQNSTPLKNFFSVKKLRYGFMLDNPAAVQFGTSAMEIVHLILLSALFAAGVGCGYYLRDRISKKRRHLVSKRSRRSQRGSPGGGFYTTSHWAI